jgi:RND family efflux transporter MFP subunit
VIGSESNGLRLPRCASTSATSSRRARCWPCSTPPPSSADVAQARAALQEAEANAAAAAADAGRARTLQSSGALSEQQITQYLDAERTARRAWRPPRRHADQQQLRLKYTQVVAPDSGIISARSATVGAVVGVGTELFRMIRQGRLEWRAEVTAAELAAHPPGLKASVGRQRQQRHRQGAHGRADGRSADAASRWSTSTCRRLQGNAPLKAGMFASGQFELGESGALTVPQQAVAVRDGFAYVFRLNRGQPRQPAQGQTGPPPRRPRRGRGRPGAGHRWSWSAAPAS